MWSIAARVCAGYGFVAARGCADMVYRKMCVCACMALSSASVC